MVKLTIFMSVTMGHCKDGGFTQIIWKKCYAISYEISPEFSGKLGQLIWKYFWGKNLVVGEETSKILKNVDGTSSLK